MKKAGLIFLIIIFLITMTLKINDLIRPVKPGSEESIYLIIEPGTPGLMIGEKLYEKNLIKSKNLFNLLIIGQGLENSLKAGTYELKPSFDMFKIINLLVEGRVATFRVTIPEGFTVDDISRRLSVLTDYTQDEFKREAEKDQGKEYLAGIHENNTIYALEGFLYPDTYIIPKDFTPSQIFAVMLSVFEERWLERLKNEENGIEKKSINSIKNQEDVVSTFTPYEIITIASMVEEEARLDYEKPLVAAVIYNRLERNMLLQIDACIQYALEERKGRVLYSDLKIDSPYNTYLYPGLPPGPIASPGATSIEAVLNPADVEYLFYFARKDGSHVFSNRYEEHLRLQNELGDE
ncbi:MAG: endolytic transglycosylase MltG [Halanaerobiaceae bacterium]